MWWEVAFRCTRKATALRTSHMFGFAVDFELFETDEWYNSLSPKLLANCCPSFWKLSLCIQSMIHTSLIKFIRLYCILNCQDVFLPRTEALEIFITGFKIQCEPLCSFFACECQLSVVLDCPVSVFFSS